MVAASNKLIVIPTLGRFGFNQFRDEVLIWNHVTEVQEDKRAGTIFLALAEENKNEVLKEMTVSQITASVIVHQGQKMTSTERLLEVLSSVCRVDPDESVSSEGKVPENVFYCKDESEILQGCEYDEGYGDPSTNDMYVNEPVELGKLQRCFNCDSITHFARNCPHWDDESAMMNIRDEYGEPLRCFVCDSLLHFARDCPDNAEYDEYNCDNSAYCTAVRDTQPTLPAKENLAVLDSGCNITVCGKKWLAKYVASLDHSDRCKVNTVQSEKVFKFSDGVSVESIGKCVIPANVCGQNVNIATEVVVPDIPLLFSKNAMERAKMVLNFDKKTTSAFGKTFPMEKSGSGHCCIDVTRKNFALNQEKGLQCGKPRLVMKTLGTRQVLDHGNDPPRKTAMSVCAEVMKGMLNT